jgi:hypothetical protein
VCCRYANPFSCCHIITILHKPHISISAWTAVESPTLLLEVQKHG